MAWLEMEVDVELKTILNDRLNASSSQIAEFCDRWNVAELALFGSVLRADFKPEESDIDVLVTFNSDYSWTFDATFQMREELMALFQRKVDLISRKSLEQSSNWLRRNQILNSAQVIYAA
ncbi:MULTISPECIES: nucleotidyltransferase family protein [Leptolyngbya]|uniref:nucleotidyltransferase family protein n=1 Tax=Leptolyngbya TaxID=47251 RepID=UPI001F555F4A|nr:nucleotidyltransferase domain-containing protein [Leptolyngbya sp. FACHB-1624]